MKYILYISSFLLVLLLSQCSLFEYSSKKTSDCNVLMPQISDYYFGECKNGLAHGDGEAEGIDSYEGEFKKGLPDGEGVYTYTNGDIYKGEFSKGEKEGDGVLIYDGEPADSSLKGVWKADSLQREEEKKYYEVLRTINLDFYRFNRIGKGKEVIIRIRRDLLASRRVRDVSVYHSSGYLNQNGNEIILTSVNFPFTCRVYFLAQNVTGMVTMEYEMKFVLKKGGIWDVKVTY